MNAPNPLLLGQIAVHEGLLTPDQLEDCVRAQERSDPPRKLGAILLEKGYLSPEKLESLMEIQRLEVDTITADPERGGLFGQIALRLGYVTQLQLDECLREQHASASGGTPVLLGQVFLRKGYLTTDQFLESLRKQKKEVVRCPGCDTLYDAKDHPEGAKFVCSRCGTVVQIPQRRPGQEETQALAPAAPDHKGQAIGRYLILEQIGQGGMGVVYKALHRDLNRIFALKVLKTGDLTTFDTVRRFQREARLAAKLSHPNIVAVHDAGEESGIHYIAMEHIDGEALSVRLIAGHGKPRENVMLLERIARAVAYAHGQGVIHRDLKPANVMVDKAGTPHIMDFGLAKQTFEGSLLTRSGAFLGTPFYMAPEQIEGGGQVVDAQSDVYALGVMLYEVLSGRLPHAGTNSAETFNKIVNHDPVPLREINAKIHPDLQTICLKAIEKDRRQRYGTAEAFAEDLRRYLEGEPILARPVGPIGRTLRRFRKNPALSVAAAALLLLAATALGLLIAASRNARAFHAHLDEAKRLKDLGDVPGTKSALELALAVRPGDADATRLLEEARQALRTVQAREDRRRAEEERRAAARPKIHEAREVLLRLGPRIGAEALDAAQIRAACAAAEATLDEALATAPGHEEALSWMARARILRGDIDGAIRHLEEACTAAPALLEARFERGRMLLRKYRRPRGLPELLVREDRPLFTDPSPDSPLAEHYRRQARGDLMHVRDRAEERWMCHYAEAAIDFLELRFAEAETRVTSYLERYAGDPEALALRALCRLYQNRPDRALRDLDLALRYLPLDAFLSDWRAITRYLTGDLAGALSDLSRPTAEPGTLCIRGTLRYLEGRHEDSRADFQKAVESAPRWADAFAGRAAALAVLGRRDEADADFQRAIDLESGEAAFWESRGLMRLRSGRLREAAADLEKAIQLSPSRKARLQTSLDAAREK